MLSPRGRRAIGLIALAVVVIVVGSLVYLHPTLPSNPTTASPTISLPPVSKQGDGVSYDFVTPSMGWALVVRTASGNGPGQFWVFRTTDAAKHWQKQFSGQTGFIGLGPETLRFFDRANGFIVIAGLTDLVYSTTDGGAHWHLVGLPGPQFGVITFSDPSHGWMFVSLGSPTDRTANLYMTDDGGNTWQRLTDPPSDVAAGVTFRGSAEGWVGSQSDPQPHVYSSSDGGRSWDRHDLPIPPDGLPPRTIATVQLLPGTGVVAFLDAGNGVALALTSFDGGRIWNYVQPRPSGSSFVGFVGFQDALNWWAIDGWTLYKSSNAGQTWTQISNQLVSSYLYVPHVLDSQHAWAQLFASQVTGLAVTADGGLHWTRATVPQPA